MESRNQKKRRKKKCETTHVGTIDLISDYSIQGREEHC
jgi:hypothetical protein